MGTVSSYNPDRLTLPNLRSLSKTRLGFRPPSNDGSGGRRTPWSLHSARAAAGPGGAWCGGTVGGKPCRAYSNCHLRPCRELRQRTGRSAQGPRSNPGGGIGCPARRRRLRHGVALRRVHPYDVFWMHGQPDAIARDTLFRGTALSAPASTLVTQAALTAVMTRRPSRRAAHGLRIVALTTVAGYLGERLVGQRPRPPGWDALESPLIIAALGHSVGMAALGTCARPQDESEASTGRRVATHSSQMAPVN
jgi:hypothetical protein